MAHFRGRENPARENHRDGFKSGAATSAAVQRRCGDWRRLHGHLGAAVAATKLLSGVHILAVPPHALLEPRCRQLPQDGALNNLPQERGTYFDSCSQSAGQQKERHTEASE